MKNVAKYAKAILVACLIIVAVSSVTSCGGTSTLSEAENKELEDAALKAYKADHPETPSFYEDNEDDSASAKPSNQVSEEPAALVDDGDGDVINPDISYVWTQTFIESNYASKPAVTAETAVIVIGSDGSGMLNEVIPCRMNGDELLIEWPWGDAGNTSTSGTLKVSTNNGKKHIEGDVKTSNADGFYVIDHWIMEEK